ncbi:MAG: sulfite exporter TauE/SafE family protein [Chloroflexi bacterium]|nr:sulfite exporter TauE/SafE family protein [Chloroflexota bacterium]
MNELSAMFYLVNAVVVFFFSGLMAMAGLGAAFLFVPLFYYMGVPLAEATAVALLLNVVSLMFASVNYWRSGLVNWRLGLPGLITAVLLAPFGARLTPYVDRRLLLGLFAAFLVFAGAMMLFYRPKPCEKTLSRGVEVGVGGAAGCFGSL